MLVFKCTIDEKLFTIRGGDNTENSTKKSCKIIMYKKKLSLIFTDPDHYMYTKCWK